MAIRTFRDAHKYLLEGRIEDLDEELFYGRTDDFFVCRMLEWMKKHGKPSFYTHHEYLVLFAILSRVAIYFVGSDLSKRDHNRFIIEDFTDAVCGEHRYIYDAGLKEIELFYPAQSEELVNIVDNDGWNHEPMSWLGVQWAKLIWHLSDK